ncbi:N-ethylmaleimide reductase [Phytophthora citrophthora]|uniref:N-ethylmaleimide reductase n=1 Tax=Phytophthora citrophthora TaxID=4793 RepID=A0AAD9LLE7_9STRA|nr:N-ethylmaleimide reductase [Phytophthora citrophthora]
MSPTADYKILTPLKLGDNLKLKNRLVVAPTTRARSDPVTRAPIERNMVYYEQRAGAGLIVTEGTAISAQGFGWYGGPALYTDAQEAAWKYVVDRVHAQDGKIFLQAWHTGRQSHPSFHPTNEVVSAVDEFLQSSTNLRTDKYGGSFENRYRILHEIVEVLKTVFPASRIGVRLSPNGAFGGMGSSDNHEMFTYVFERLSEHGLAYLSVLDGFGFGYHDKSPTLTVFDVKKAFKGVVMANNSYTRDTAEGVVRSGAADLVAFGRLYMSNPDLAERVQNDWPVNDLIDYEFFWDGEKGDEGYITIPTYQPTNGKTV